MANANWSNPTLTSTYTNFVSEVKNRDEDLALQFDGTTSTNIPTNAIRWDSSAGRWKKWNGTAWAELAATYALTALSTTGNASIGGTLGVTGAVTLTAGGTTTTAAVDNNSTTIASTAYVVGQAAGTTPVMDGTAAVGTSLRYARQDHVHPTDTSRAPLASPTFTGTVTVPNLNGGCLAGTRNRVINGEMKISQRGTSFTTPSAGAYTLDRWLYAGNGTGATISQVTGTGSYKNALRIAGVTGNTQAGIIQRIESLNTSDLSGATVTLSVNLVASANQTVQWQLTYANAADNFATGTAITSGTWSVTTSAQTFTATVANLPSGVTNGMAVVFYANNTGAFTSGTLDITGVQLEQGTVATPFERRSHGQELALCQRYYEIMQPFTAMFPWASTTQIIRTMSAFSVSKRTVPTITLGPKSEGSGTLAVHTAYAEGVRFSGSGNSQDVVTYISTVASAEL